MNARPRPYRVRWARVGFVASVALSIAVTCVGLLAVDQLRDREREVAALQAERAGYVSKITALRKGRDVAEADLGAVRSAYAAARRQLREQDLLLSFDDPNNAGMSGGPLAGPPVPKIDGAVVAIKDTIEPALVLLSVGSDDHVEVGFHFSIYRGSQYVGKVVVERVLRDSCGCRVLFTLEGQVIQVADSAATRLQ